MKETPFQNIPPSLFLERLVQLLPALDARKITLRRLSTRTVEDAMGCHGIELEWLWEPIGGLGDLSRSWSITHDEELLIAKPSSQRVASTTPEHIISHEAQSRELFDGQDIVILGRDKRFVGLFDAQYKHAFVLLPRLLPDPLHFYSVAHEFGQFSNFAPFPIRLHGKIWPTSEHYFQAQKFAGTAYEESVRQAKTPMEAARMGRKRSLPLRPDWESVKLGVMRQALQAKFTQHEELRALLMATTPSKLVEHTEHDSFWGDGGDGKGHNWLGRLLMQLRDELHGQAQ